MRIWGGCVAGGRTVCSALLEPAEWRRRNQSTAGCELAIAGKERNSLRRERTDEKATALAVGDWSWDGVDDDARLWCWVAFRPPVTVPGPARRAN